MDGPHIKSHYWHYLKGNKCSAVAEMGDRLATTDMDQNMEGCAPLAEGELGPHLTQCRLGQGLPPYQVASWSIQPFRHNRHGPKIRGLCPFGRGARSPSNSVARSEAYLQAKFHLDPSSGLATIDMGRKLGAAVLPFLGGGWVRI